MRLDLQWWDRFLPTWNGIRSLGKHRPTIYMWTDASGGYGMGGYISQNPAKAPLPHLVYSHRFSTRLSPKHINFKEMTSVVFAMRKWLDPTRGKHLAIHGDNYAVVSGLRKRSIQGAAMALLRDIRMLLAKHDITITLRGCRPKITPLQTFFHAVNGLQ